MAFGEGLTLKLKADASEASKTIQATITSAESQAKKSLTNLKAQASKYAGEAVRDFSNEIGNVADQIGGVFGDIANQLQDTFRSVFDKISKYTAGQAKNASAPAQGGADSAGAVAGAGASAALGPIMAIVAVIGLIIYFVKQLVDYAKQSYDALKNQSKSLKAMDDAYTKTMNSVFKPIGDFVAIMMRPYVSMMMRFIRPQLAKGREIAKQVSTGQISLEEGQKQIQGIFATIYPVVNQMNSMMQQAITPVTTGVKALESIFDTSWIDGLKATLGSWGQAVGAWSMSWNPLMQGVRDDWRNTMYEAIATNSTVFNVLPSDAKKEMLTRIGEGSVNLKDLPGGVATDWKTILTAPANTDVLKQINPELYSAISKNLTGEEATKPIKLAGEETVSLVGLIKGSVSDINTKYVDISTKVSEAWGTVTKKISEVIEQAKSWNPFGGGGGGGNGGGLLQGLVNFAVNPLGTIANALGGGSKTQTPTKKAGGGTIQETGLHFLHAGETVNPVGRNSGSKSLSVKIGDINIKVDKMTSDTDVSRLSKQVSDNIMRDLSSRGVF